MNLSEFRESQEEGFNAASLTHQCKITGDVYVLIDRTSPELLIEVRRYVLYGKIWTIGILYTGNDYICAMDKFQECLNGCIVDPLDGLSFICPECGKYRIECCQDGHHASRVTCINEEGDHDYGDLLSHGEVCRWQCESCGYVLENNGEDITDNVEMAEWVRENCKTPEVEKN